ncbi:hypothetical protein QZH56_12270 [Streptomyces olivoreticuli]|uniref:hypothetical protein n=1 Tax=Streptomyces olivoreticuli TaxID=68246 RepID=UPI00265A4820|nr:hypothetical protein [Streptomyces olivoreticuli]WKK26295.1 hypothetical protein QZH56_12270 [Streptomyces olivoreticuli]
MRNVTRRPALATIGALALMGALGMTQPAWAADITTVYTTDYAGHASWDDGARKLTVCDDKADGWGTRAYVYRPNSGDPGNGTVLLKVNDPNASGPCQHGYLASNPGGHISLKVCSYQGARVEDCDWKKIR